MDNTKRLIIISFCIVICFNFLACEDSKDIMMNDYMEVNLPDNFNIPRNMKIVALGEATHGNHEFGSIRNEMVKYMVQEYGVRAIALEIGFDSGLIANAFILGKLNIEAEDVAAFMSMPFYTAETVKLLQWLKAYNDSKDEIDQIRIYGMNMQYEATNTALSVATLAYLAKSSRLNEYIELSNNIRHNARRGLKTDNVFEQLKTLSMEDFENTGAQKYYEILLKNFNSIVFEENDDMLYETWDFNMAKTVEWIANYEHRYYGNDSLFIYAHSAHIAKGLDGYEDIPMGEYLSSTYGNEYFAICTDFKEGDVNIKKHSSMVPTNICIIKPMDALFPDGFVTYKMFNNLNLKEQAIFTSHTIITRIGYSDFGPRYLEQIPTKLFDAIIYFQKVTPSYLLANTDRSIGASLVSARKKLIQCLQDL